MTLSDWTLENENHSLQIQDPAWLSQVFESGFVRLIQTTSHDQISQMPQIIQNAVKVVNSTFVSICI